MFIVLLGAPGSGKGTISKILAKKLKLAHISTGDLFRENQKNETELGKQIKEYMEKGELVPDNLTIKMLENRLQEIDIEKGAILDGFPRTIKQAEALDKLLAQKNAKIDIALDIEVPFEEIIERIANRRICRNCSAIYNIVFNPPKKEGMCDECGGELYQREDQKPEVVQNRLKIYKNSSEELIKYYDKKHILKIENENKVGMTSYEIAELIENELKNKE